MVTVTGFKKILTENGESYVRIIIEGDLEMIKSETTGNYYAHAKKASVSSTFDEATAQSMVGRNIQDQLSNKK